MNETTKSGLDRIKAAAQTLTELRHTGRFIARLPEATRPQTVDDALRIQERTIKILGEVGGYKCSVPNAERTAPVAPIFASTIHSDVPYKVRQASPGSAGTARIEPEIAFMIGRDLPPRDTPYTENEVRDAIKASHMVLEILGSRHHDAKAIPFIEHMADWISNQGLFVGPALNHSLDSSIGEIPLTIMRLDTEPMETIGTYQGHHPDGHPLLPLYWVANFLASRGNGLRAGQIVTTGSYAGAIDVPLDVPLRVMFGELGSVQAEFTAAPE